MNNQKFEELNAYKACREFRIEISKLVKAYLPYSEKRTLSNQIIRSSRSVTANIAEGYGRYYYQDNIKFCRYSRGSLEETLEHLITAYDEGYITKEILENYRKKYENCIRLINGYIRYLAKSKSGSKVNEPSYSYGNEEE